MSRGLFPRVHRYGLLYLRTVEYDHWYLWQVYRLSAALPLSTCCTLFLGGWDWRCIARHIGISLVHRFQWHLWTPARDANGLLDTPNVYFWSNISSVSINGNAIFEGIAQPMWSWMQSWGESQFNCRSDNRPENANITLQIINVFIFNVSHMLQHYYTDKICWRY